MVFKKCGKELLDLEKVCSNCKGQLKDETNKKEEYVLLNEEVILQDDIEKNKFISIFSYLSVLILIPLFIASDSKYVRFHVIQGINLLILDVIYAIISCLLNFTIVPNYVFRTSNSPIPILIVLVNFVLGIFIVVLSAVGVINAVNGKVKELPVIGKIRLIK